MDREIVGVTKKSKYHLENLIKFGWNKSGKVDLRYANMLNRINKIILRIKDAETWDKTKYKYDFIADECMEARILSDNIINELRGI